MKLSKPVLPSRVVISYILDYLIIIFFIVAFTALDKAEPYHQLFSIHNKSLQYPFADPERVSPLVAAVVACVFPLLVIIIWTMAIDGLFSHHKTPSTRRNVYGTGRTLGVYTIKQRLWELNCGVLGLGLSVAAAITITGALKNLTGKPRPDVISRCQLPTDYVEPDPGLTSYKVCTGDSHILKDGFKSWPSGHSSTAFAGLGYLSIYVAGKLHVLDNRGEVWKTFLVMVPLIAASMIAISRIMDGRHHPFDVISSSLLGLFVAWLSYRQYFPSLSETWKKGRAYPIRSWGREPPKPIFPEPTDSFLPTDEEQVKSSYPGTAERGLATGSTRGIPMAEGGVGGVDISSQRRRQYLDEQDYLEHRRRKTHDFYDTVTGPSQAPSLPLPVTTSLGPRAYQPTPVTDDEASFSGSDQGYELRDRNAAMTGTQTTGGSASYQPYGTDTGYRPPHRQNTQSTDDSHESEDRKWGIAAATNALSGQTTVFTPIQEEHTVKGPAGYGVRRGSEDDFVKVGKGVSDTSSPPRAKAMRPVELRDDGPIDNRV